MLDVHSDDVSPDDVICPIIGIIEFFGPPVYAKLFLACSVPEPVESHVHGLCMCWCYFVIDYSIGH